VPAVDTPGNEYNAGWQTVDVTPQVGCYLAGYAARSEPSTGIYRRLEATVAAIDDGGDPVILVSVEWLGFYERTEEARKRISHSTGVGGDRIILTATHTHAGPAIREVDLKRHGEWDEAYMQNALDQLAGAAVKALEQRHACKLRFGSDWCGFAVSRRAPDGKGGVRWTPSLDAPHDHSVTALFLEREDNEKRLVFFNYACHPTSTGPILQIGGDYPGFACDRIRDCFDKNTTAAFLNACAGDQRPGPPGGGVQEFLPYSVEEVRGIGYRLGDAVARANHNACDITGPIRVAQTFATLTYTPLDRGAVSECAASPKTWEREWAEHYAGTVETGPQTGKDLPFEVQTLRFGDSLAIVTLAGETNVEYGLRLKRELHGRFEHVMVVAYANEIVGYVPVDRQIPEGGYEVADNQRMMLRPGPFANGMEDRIIASVWHCVQDG
jgi:neutral ceramidase